MLNLPKNSYNPVCFLFCFHNMILEGQRFIQVKIKNFWIGVDLMSLPSSHLLLIKSFAFFHYFLNPLVYFPVFFCSFCFILHKSEIPKFIKSGILDLKGNRLNVRAHTF